MKMTEDVVTVVINDIIKPLLIQNIFHDVMHDRINRKQNNLYNLSPGKLSNSIK